ncbi:hypothetical protein [Natrarchaeobaculum aegyptiacum]|uniref:hypothetical protein n=1 Tax=Natrarchaeobaculum aegyptiacum TaxID=745377 RepID=UPI001E4E8506|nr:hypothetical protein [Natrarchaeobaculum aegyptiacum]
MTDRPPRVFDPRDDPASDDADHWDPLTVALVRIRRDPRLIVPFLLAGVFLTLVDYLRLEDPIPTVERAVPWSNGVSIDLAYAGFPTGVPQTTTHLESLVGLHPEYLAWGLALYLFPLLAVAAAGAVTIARAMDQPVRLEAVGAVFGFVLAADLLHRLLGSIELLQGMGLVGVPLLVGYLLVTVRLFAVPGLLVAGRSFVEAIRESARRTRGRGWTIVGVIFVVGLSSWFLASVAAGTFVTTALVAPLHAVAIVSLLEWDTADG